MSFILYEARNTTLYSTDKPFYLAGDHAIRKLWYERGQPLNEGWEISAQDILAKNDTAGYDQSRLRLVSDYHPRSRKRIGIVELKKIYLYTLGCMRSGKAVVEWTPLMMEMRGVYYKEFPTPLSDAEIAAKKKKLPIPHDDSPIMGFLYLKGENWTFGKPGAVNATFLYGAAREYFRQYF